MSGSAWRLKLCTCGGLSRKLNLAQGRGMVYRGREVRVLGENNLRIERMAVKIESRNNHAVNFDGCSDEKMTN